MDRRRFICHTAVAAGAATLPATLFARTAPTIFRWVPANDLSILDPTYTTAAITATRPCSCTAACNAVVVVRATTVTPSAPRSVRFSPDGSS